MEEEFSGPPMTVNTAESLCGFNLFWRVSVFSQFIIFVMQVLAEVLLGLGLCMWAGLTVPGKFLSIHPDSEENRYGFFTIFFSVYELILLLNQIKIEGIFFYSIENL